MKKIQTPISRSIGDHEMKICVSRLCSSSGFASMTTPAFSRSLTSHGSDGWYVLNRLPSVLTHFRTRPSIVTLST